MTNLAKVVWSEGMHLAQHHFQTQSRYHEETVRFSLSQLFVQPYGFSWSVLDQEAIGNGIVRLSEAVGIMPDGTPFQIPDVDPAPDDLEVDSALDASDYEAIVYLTLPVLQLGRPNSSSDGDPGARYQEMTRMVVDENSGGDEKPVSLGRKNFCLRLGSPGGPGATALPLARLRREADGRHFSYDSRFIPPCVQIRGSLRLMDLLKGLVHLLERKAQVLGEETGEARSAIARYGGRDLSGYWLAHAIHSGLVPLSSFLRSGRTHPETVYLEMARLAGALCTFRIPADPDRIPFYDHDDLEECFGALDRFIRDHLEVPLPVTSEVVPLRQRGVPSVFTGSLREDMCADTAQWYLGVRSDRGRSRIISAVETGVKFAATSDLPLLIRTSGMGGLPVEHQAQPPSELTSGRGWAYFLVRRVEPQWRAIRDSLEFGLWIPDELLDAELTFVIVNEPTA